MKPRFISALLLLALAFCLNANAQTVSEEDARAKALAFFSAGAKKLPAKNGMKRQAPAVQEVKLAYTSVKDGKICFYVFNNGNDGGFVIVGGDEIAKEILAYVPQGHFDYEKAPANVKWWLGEYEKEISTAKKFASQKQQDSAPKRAASSVQELFTDIPDLISTKWNQGEPYNAAIPEIQHTDGSSIVSPTGCVNTAVAQIMNYWKWPVTGEGSYSYTLDYDGMDEWSAGVAEGSFDGLLPATFSADFGNTTYDWDNMLDDYTVGTPTQTQIDAVSTLMYHVGVSEHTLYGPGGSAGGADSMMKALKDNFKYSDRMSYLERGDYLDDEWEEIIYSELQNGRPLYYESSLHAFVLHGYSKELNMFSVNWGWGGFMDGYYQIIGTNYAYFINDENYVQDYVTHGIIIHIEPNNTAHPNAFSEVGDTITVGGICYDLIGPLSKTVEVTYARNNEKIYEGEVTIPETISYDNELYTVSKIGRYGLCGAWYDITSDITSIHLPNTLRSIARGGLARTGIKELTIPENVEMLGIWSCGDMFSLTSINLPSQLSYIPHDCFSNCSSLETINLPASIKVIGADSFTPCNSMKLLIINSIEVPTVEIINNHPFTNPEVEGHILAVPRNSIENYKNDPLFGLWHTIVPIDSIPQDYGKRIEVDNVIYKVEFNNFSVVGYNGEGYNVDLVIPSSVNYENSVYPVTTIQRAAFENKQFKSLRIEEGIQEIGDNAFMSNFSLTNLYLPSTLHRIGVNAFRYCDLQYISVDERNTVFDSRNDCNALIETASNTLIYGSLNAKIPYTVTAIAEGAFYSLYNLVSINIPNPVATIGDWAFCDIWNLKSIRISNSVESIGSQAFAFSNALEDVYCYATSIPSSNTNIFDYVNLKNVTLYVPAESVEAYRTTLPWSDFGEILPIIPIESIQLSDMTLEKSSAVALIPQVFPINATQGQLFYSSSNPKVATISPDGMITAVEVGEAIITAETLDGKSATCKVTVMPKKSMITYLVDGDVYNATNIECGSVIELPDAPVKDGYTFYCWEGLPDDMIMPDHDITVTAVYAIRGDVNLDEKVNVTDAVDIVNDRLGYESTNFIHILSDVNRDENYTITDAIAVLNIMYGEPVGANAVPRKVQSQEESLDLNQLNNNTIALDLNCANGYTAFQFDVELPEGIMLDGISLNENRCKDFAVRFNKTDNNIYKVVAYNLSNEPLTIGGDNLLTINLSGANESDEVRLTNIHFSTLKAVDVLFDDLSLSMTDGILLHTVSSDCAEYNVAGMRVNKDYRGIVIVNGKKVIRK